MSYDVVEVKSIPASALGIQNEIDNATSDGSELVCIEIDSVNKRLLIITKSK